MQNVNLTNHFLIAMPAMADPYFSRSLTYICEHNEQGALGLVVNRPVDMSLQTLFDQIGISAAAQVGALTLVHFGGPVQMDRGFVLHAPVGNWQSTLAINDEIGLTSSKDILESVAKGEPPEKILVTLGYAGWAPGQLEYELTQNAWLTVAASPQVIFDIPAEERFPAAMELLGIDPLSLASGVGHA